jgi:sulfane dehydrogenase subunit SoxC
MHRLMINGLVDTPLVFTMEDLMRFPRENRTYFLECAANTGMEWRGAQLNGCQFTHGMIHNVVYTGVPLGFFWKKRACAPTPHGSCRKGRTPRP